MIDCRSPQNKQEFENYYYLRWQVLREPWGQPLGSEQDDMESQAIHRSIYDGEKLLAVGRLHFVDQFNAQIRYMAVAQEVQGGGYGKQIVNALEHEAKRRGAKTITLNARENVVSFYQQLGYQVIEKSHLLYDEIQHYLMTKSIAKFLEHQQELAEQLQATWHQTIPLSQAMNITISHYDGKRLLTNCDPVFNKNLHNTMFAGSIYTLATLTGWGWVYLQLTQSKVDGDIVLADASIKYLAPIAGVVSAKTHFERVDGDVSPLTINKKARFTVNVEVLSGDIIAAKFTGYYVVLPKHNKKS